MSEWVKNKQKKGKIPKKAQETDKDVETPLIGSSFLK